MNDFADAVFYKGQHKFVFENFNFTLGELKSSLSTATFVKKAKKMVPDVESYMFDKGTAGVRAQAMDQDGKLIMDFQIEKIDNQIHLLNAPPPEQPHHCPSQIISQIIIWVEFGVCPRNTGWISEFETIKKCGPKIFPNRILIKF